MRAVVIPDGMIFRCEGCVAQVLVAVIACEVEVCEPDVAVAAAGGDECHVPAIRRPDRRVVGCGVFGDGEDGLGAVIDRDNGNFKVVVGVGFKGKPLRVG